jgi:hypothetical protein
MGKADPPDGLVLLRVAGGGVIGRRAGLWPEGVAIGVLLGCGGTQLLYRHIGEVEGLDLAKGGAEAAAQLIAEGQSELVG